MDFLIQLTSKGFCDLIVIVAVSTDIMNNWFKKNHLEAEDNIYFKEGII
jgi:hypothetical protein